MHGVMALTLSNTVDMQDVAWHSKHEYMFGSVGDDKQLIIWDTRQPAAASACSSTLVVSTSDTLGVVLSAT